MTGVVFPIFIGILALVVVVVCVVAIIMSTTQGSAWLESSWNKISRR